MLRFEYTPSDNYYFIYRKVNNYTNEKIIVPVGTFLVDFLSLDLTAIEQELNTSIQQDKYKFDLALYHSTKITNILRKYCNEFSATLICDDICYPERTISQRTQLLKESYSMQIEDIKYYLLNGKFRYDSIFSAADFEVNNFQEITVNFGLNDTLTTPIILYTVKDLYSMLSLDLINIKYRNIPIKQCENCKKFFIPNKRSDEIYCDRIYRNGKTCKELGYSTKISEDPFKAAFTKARKTQHARIRYNKHIKDYRQKHYEPWLSAASKARDYFSKKGDINSFLKWLDEHKNSF